MKEVLPTVLFDTLQPPERSEQLPEIVSSDDDSSDLDDDDDDDGSDGSLSSDTNTSCSENENNQAPIGFKKRSDLTSNDEYARYVKENITVGMMVRCCRTYEEVHEGDIGRVIKVNSFVGPKIPISANSGFFF